MALGNKQLSGCFTLAPEFQEIADTNLYPINRLA